MGLFEKLFGSGEVDESSNEGKYSAEEAESYALDYSSKYVKVGKRLFAIRVKERAVAKIAQLGRKLNESELIEICKNAVLDLPKKEGDELQNFLRDVGQVYSQMLSIFNELSREVEKDDVSPQVIQLLLSRLHDELFILQDDLKYWKGLSNDELNDKGFDSVRVKQVTDVVALEVEIWLKLSRSMQKYLRNSSKLNDLKNYVSAFEQQVGVQLKGILPEGYLAERIGA